MRQMSSQRIWMVQPSSKCIKNLVGKDVYMKILSTSEQGGCQEVADGTQHSDKILNN